MEGRVAQPQRMELREGSRVGVIGGGPAGSLFAYFLLSFARRLDMELQLDVFEPRDFSAAGPAGCNMCGGIVSETLVQALAAEGVSLPPSIVQRGIESYVLHTTHGPHPIETPLREKRIAALHRGGGPRDSESLSCGGLDGYLLGLAHDLGASVVRTRVTDVRRDDQGRPLLTVKGGERAYDLLVGATGVNSNSWPLFEKLGLPSRPPRTAKTFVTELRLGRDAVSERFGDAMHLFLLDIAHLDCAAMIPKGDYVTVCLLGAGIGGETVDAFFASEPVRRCLPPDAAPGPGACRCAPRINEREAARPFADRVVLVGDCGVSRLYKDGIGAAYRTAKCAARTAAFSGVGSADFQRHYAPLYRRIARDNRYGMVMFTTVRAFKVLPFLLRGALAMAGREQSNGGERRMSTVLWDMFTGSAPYRDIFLRTLDPRFLAGFWRSVATSALGLSRASAVSESGDRHSAAAAYGERPATLAKEGGMGEGALGHEWRDGEIVCRQGEPGDRMYVVQSGHADVVCEEGGQEVLLDTLGPGDVFGYMAIVDKQPRSATVRVRGGARVLTLDKREFLRRVHEDPSLAYHLLEMMSRTVRSLDAELAAVRNASRVQMVRHVYVVPRDRPALFEQLSREFSGDGEVEVVLDRRLGERRRCDSPSPRERRRGERRTEDAPWDVRLSVSYRRGRGRAPDGAPVS